MQKEKPLKCFCINDLGVFLCSAAFENVFICSEMMVLLASPSSQEKEATLGPLPHHNRKPQKFKSTLKQFYV